MIHKERKASVNGMAVALLILLNAIFLKSGYIENGKYYWPLLISIPLLIIAILDLEKE